MKNYTSHKKIEKKQYKKKANITKINRKLEKNNSTNTTETDYEGEIKMEEYLTKPLSESKNYDFREANISNITEINKNEKDQYSNLTELSIKTIENENIKMEDGILNSTIVTIIDKNGLLESVIEKSYSSMNTKTETEEDNELDEETNELYEKIYNKNNQISLEDIINSQEPNNNISFALKNVLIQAIHIINCSDSFENKDLNKELYEYFDNFKYELYNIIDDSNKYNETSNETEKVKNLTRNLEEEDDISYYGIKKITYVKQLYKYNLIGIKMEGQIFAENDPSTGSTTSYFVVKFGNINVKMKIEDQHTNMHIILDRKNQMGYKLLLLLNQTNYDLMERTIIYDRIIIDIEKNFIRCFEDYYDFSNLFREPLNQMYQQVLNFSGEFFNELIELIKIVHNNYTLIYNNILNNKYEFVNAIREITKEEYIKYIYEMIEILSNFENSTLLFLKEVENELDNITDFQIDVLYDIIDQIYEAKLIFKQFNKYLFKSIEKGILTFKYDIRDYIEEFIGDLLYITDFLSINLNKNEILIKSIEENTRNITTRQLKDFRNIILSIMELLISNINDDYDKEMNLSNEQGIKYHSNKIAIEFLMKLEDQSNEVIENIKSRINNFYIYQSYSENIDELNNINNKTIIEYINDIYDNIILNSLYLKPDFLNESSYINKNKDKLFQMSKDFVSETNKEINEINIYIQNYTLDYIEKNLYMMYYNLYYFRKSFLDEEMKNLLNEFYLLLNRTINIHFKGIMNYNYNLLLKVLKEEKAFFNRYCFRDRRMLCSGFIQRFEMYKANFEKYLLLTYSEEFLNLLEKYFYKLRDDILNYIKNKLLSIKE